MLINTVLHATPTYGISEPPKLQKLYWDSWLTKMFLRTKNLKIAPAFTILYEEKHYEIFTVLISNSKIF